MRASRCRAVLFLLGAGLPALAWPAPRLSVGPVEPPGTALARQLEEALCGGGACAPWAQVSTKGKLDTRKAAALGVQGVLTGSVTWRGGAAALALSFYTGKAAPARTWKLPVEAGDRLSEPSLQRLQADLAVLLGVPVSTLRPATPPPIAKPGAAAVAVSTAPPAPTTKPAPAATPTPAAPPTPAATATGTPEPDSRPLVAVEVGLDLAHRSLTYQGATPAGAPLLGVEVPGIVSPLLRLELYPARGASGLVRGLGLRAAYQRSIGLTTRVADGGPSSDTTAQRLSAGVLWRTPPLGAWRVTLVPAVNYERHTVTNQPAIAGLPDAELWGVGGSLGLELPLSPRVDLLAGAGWIWWIEAADLVKGAPPFFPGQGASAFDAELGVDVDVGRGLSVRALLGARIIGYALDPDPTGTYAADGARDSYLGGRVTVRLER
jgi:hypothetical protein